MDLRKSSSSSTLSSLTTHRQQSTSNSPPILSRVEQNISNIYYKYGLLCSRHPFLVIVFTLIIVSVCCYPITGIRYLLGNSSQKFITSFDSSVDINGDNMSGSDRNPQWFDSNLSYAYIQQIVVKSSVIPWKDNLILMDAIRAPLSQSFKLMESISNYQYFNGQTPQSLNNLCFQVSEPFAKMVDKQSASYLPTFSCLMISPANIWQNDINNFLQDSTIIKTLYSVKDLASPHSSGSLRDILFGIPWMETGIKRLYVRTRQRTITYAITIVLSKHSQQYINGLTNFLSEKYPLNPSPSDDNQTDSEESGQESEGQTLTHIYFQNKFTLTDLYPLLATYLMLFLYIYFSVRKIDLIKNKWALALCSVLTVIMSLLMSLGICLRFGFNPTLNGTHILPYIVIIIGLENMLVLTKSVVSTAAHLDIKVRVAQGLSREGWSITQNLLFEITVLTGGFFTFVPILQKLCLFATVGLLSDFFIQMTFFATVLSIDIQRIEINGKGQSNGQINRQTHSRHNSSTDVNGLISYGNRSYPQNVFARPAKPSQLKMPKRLRVVYFVAKTRLVQRALMLSVFVWIIFLVYNFGIIEHLGSDSRHTIKDNIFEPTSPQYSDKFNRNTKTEGQNSKRLYQTTAKTPNKSNENILNKTFVSQTHRLSHLNPNLWRQLSSQHWSALFNYYNISLSGKFITILPPILLSIPVDPKYAIQTRNPSESDPQIFRQFLSPPGIQSIDPNDDRDDNFNGLYADTYPHIPFQWTSGEIFITVALSVPSIIFIIYVFVLMYRCMCTRNYAEWRDSWAQTLQFGKSQSNKKGNSVYDTYLDFETNPIRLQDHEQELNTLASNSDTPFVMSVCMDGDIRIWDVLSGECHTYIKRWSVDHNSVMTKRFQPSHKPSGSFSSDSTYGSSPGNSNEFLTENSNNCLETNPKQNNNLTQFSDNISLHTFHSPISHTNSRDGYNFSSFISSQQSSHSSENILTELILNAAVNSEEISLNEFSVNHKIVSSLPFEPIWCSEIFGKLVIVGCRDGRIEVWDAITGDLCFCYDDNKSGVTALRAANTRLIVSRLNGTLEIFKLEIINGFSVTVSSSSMSNTATPHPAKGQVIRYNLLHSVRAHLQPITALQIESSNIITGSLDHLLKVYRTDTANCVFTLHGHCGGITTIHIDQYSPSSAISGCQVGQVCVWDVMTGTCVFSLEAHMDASVTALMATPLYFISSGTDNKICIWDKYSGHLVHSIPNHHSICKEMLLLTPNVLVTAREDHLVLWDISEANALRIVALDANCDKQNYIKNLKISSQSRAVVCDYGKQLCVIHFPSATEKCD